MSEPVLAALVLAPVFLALGATAIAWRFISHPALFFVVTLLSLFGIQQLMAPAAIAIFMPNAKGLTRASANAAYVRGVVAGAVVELVGAAALCWWLYRALRKP